MLTTVFLVLSCGQKDKKDSNNTDNLPYATDWADSMLANYIRHTDNELIKLALTDTIPEEWLFDDVVTRNNTRYLVYHIGHDVEDEDAKRFVTDGWVYIDSLDKTLYEYDLINDTLIKWETNN